MNIQINFRKEFNPGLYAFKARRFCNVLIS